MQNCKTGEHHNSLYRGQARLLVPAIVLACAMVLALFLVPASVIVCVYGVSLYYRVCLEQGL